jgi:hypothetical protein
VETEDVWESFQIEPIELIEIQSPCVVADKNFRRVQFTCARYHHPASIDEKSKMLNRGV